ncbi:MAG: hypothetical protein ACE5EZ_03190 [Thermodesulfobacteriota bacterium]
MKVCLACGVKFNSNGRSCPSCLEYPVIKDDFLTFAPELADANEGFEPEFFEKLFSLESGSFWFNSRNKLILRALQKFFSSPEKFLEIGCATVTILFVIWKALRQRELYRCGMCHAL